MRVAYFKAPRVPEVVMAPPSAAAAGLAMLAACWETSPRGLLANVIIFLEFMKINVEMNKGTNE